MAVNLIQLAAALRLGDGVTAPTEPVAGILSRLLGVSQAFVAIAAPLVDEAVADEATIRMTATLYDSPTAAAGDRYAAAWRNSGAENLVSRWVVRRAGSEGEGVPAGLSTGGLDEAQVLAIVDGVLGDHTDISDAHHTPPTGGGDVTAHNAAGDSHEDIRESLEGERITQDDVATTAQRLIDGAGHATNVDLGVVQAAIQQNADDLTEHEGTPHGGGGTPATPTPPAVLVDAAAYTAHGDVTVAGWRDYDFVQLFYAVGGNTYMTPPVNTVQLIAFTSLIVSIGRNVEWTITIDAADDDVITTAQSTSGNAVAAPTATSTMSVIAWRAG